MVSRSAQGHERGRALSSSSPVQNEQILFPVCTEIVVPVPSLKNKDRACTDVESRWELAVNKWESGAIV